MIQVRNLTKYYSDLRRGQIVALAGISFCAVPGEIFGLLGPNGARKTTALRILSTVLRPSDGSASVNGFSIGHPAGSLDAAAEIGLRLGQHQRL